MADDEETLDYIAEILEIIAETSGVETEVLVEEEDGTIHAEYLGDGDELAVLIGHHGQSLDAIQHLAHRMAFRGLDERKPLSLNAAGYRERRATALHAVADQAAEAAVRDGRPVSLDPMGAQERKLVHEYLKTRFDVETYSEGQEPARRLVVAPVVATA
jgi:spoIIIJ-associated protein